MKRAETQATILLKKREVSQNNNCIIQDSLGTVNRNSNWLLYNLLIHVSKSSRSNSLKYGLAPGDLTLCSSLCFFLSQGSAFFGLLSFLGRISLYAPSSYSSILTSKHGELLFSSIFHISAYIEFHGTSLDHEPRTEIITMAMRMEYTMWEGLCYTHPRRWKKERFHPMVNTSVEGRTKIISHWKIDYYEKKEKDTGQAKIEMTTSILPVFKCLNVEQVKNRPSLFCEVSLYVTRIMYRSYWEAYF